MSFFPWARNRPKGNAEVIRSAKELLPKLESLCDSIKRAAGDKERKRFEDELKPIHEELTRNLSQMKQTLMGTTEVAPDPQQSTQLIESLVQEDALYPLSTSIARLPFETRKDVQNIFVMVLRSRETSLGAEPPASPAHSRSNSTSSTHSTTATSSGEPLVLQHIVNDRPEIITALCRGYDRRESGMACGQILREGLKSDSIAALILYDEPQEDGKPRSLRDVDPEVPSSGRGVFWKFFDWINEPNAFEVGADAFSTFSELLSGRHKKLTAHYLKTNYPHFIATYHAKLIQSPSYVTKRQSIHLLSTILLERSNYPIMTTYIQSSANLKLCMLLLRDDRRMLNYEAFHIFKIFVANPKKSDEVVRILRLNRERLLRFLPTFLEDKCGQDVQLGDEKSYCIKIIEGLPPAAGPGAQAGGHAAGGQGGAAVPV